MDRRRRRRRRRRSASNSPTEQKTQAKCAKQQQVHQILRHDESSIIKTKNVLNNNNCIKFSAAMKA
jgi:hypothetical protein